MNKFFDGLAKMIQGKPVFEASSGNESQPEAQAYNPPVTSITERPLVTIEQVEYYERGSEMILNMHVRNHSQQMVTLHIIECFGKQRRLGLTVNAGSSREINEVYRGPLLRDTARRTVELDYKGEGGNLFRTVHRAEYQHEANNAYGVHEVRYEPPIRDI